MKRSFFILFTIVSIISMFAISTVAIMDFQPKGVDKNSVSIVTDLFRDMLFGKHIFTVVDRNSMKQIMKEQNLQQSLGCSSEECAVQIGKILGVNDMVIGTLGKLGDAYILSVRMVSVENAKIIWAKTAKIYDFNRIDEGVSALVDDLVNLYTSGQLGAVSVPTQPQQTTVQQAPQSQPQSQQVKKSTNSGGQNVTIIMQGGNQEAQSPTTVQPQQIYTPKSPPIGFDLQLGFSFLYFYDYDHYIPSADYDYNENSKQSFLHFKLDAYFSGFDLGFNVKSFVTHTGTTVNWSDDSAGTTNSGSSTMSEDWSTSYMDFSLGYRMKTGRSGFSLFSLLYRSLTSDNFPNGSFGGPGLDIFFRFGGINNRHETNGSPIGGVFELDLNFAYLFYSSSDPSYIDPNFSAIFGGGIGVGLVFKPIGAYLIIGYDINIHYTTWDDLNLFIMQHGVELKLGVNFDFQSILG